MPKLEYKSDNEEMEDTTPLPEVKLKEKKPKTQAQIQ